MSYNFRIGKLRSPWWITNSQPGSYGGKNYSEAKTSPEKDEFYMFAGAGLRSVAYNAFLQGQFRKSEVEISSNNIERVIGEVWIGVSKETKNGFRVSYAIRHQTKEAKLAKLNRSLTWGAFIFTKTFR